MKNTIRLSVVSMLLYVTTSVASECTKVKTTESAVDCLEKKVEALHKLLDKEQEKRNQHMVIQSGNVVFGHTDSGWTLSLDSAPKGSNDSHNTRSFVKHIPFPKQFESKPSVSVGMSTIDATSGGFSNDSFNIRVKIEVLDDDIDESGFRVRIKTWDASKLSGVGVSWIAYALPK